MSDFVPLNSYFSSRKPASNFLKKDSFDEWMEDILVDQYLQKLNDSRIVYTKKGQVSKRQNRADYSRGPKKQKAEKPWESCYFLKLITDPNVVKPTHSTGKEFIRLFRLPFPVFQDVVIKCKATDDPLFNYPDYHFTGQANIPIELKILAALRVLAAGLLFKDGSLVSQFIAEGTLNSFLKSFAPYLENISNTNTFDCYKAMSSGLAPISFLNWVYQDVLGPLM